MQSHGELNSIEAAITRYIATELLADDAPAPGENEPLVTTGRIDSLGLLDVLNFIHQRYDIDLIMVAPSDVYDTVASFADAVRRHQGAK